MRQRRRPSKIERASYPISVGLGAATSFAWLQFVLPNADWESLKWFLSVLVQSIAAFEGLVVAGLLVFVSRGSLPIKSRPWIMIPLFVGFLSLTGGLMLVAAMGSEWDIGLAKLLSTLVMFGGFVSMFGAFRLVIDILGFRHGPRRVDKA